MKKLKEGQLNNFLILLLLISTIFLFTFSIKNNNNNKYYEYSQKNYKVFTFAIPDTVYFAGQLIDLTNPFIRERVESEIYSIAYFHSQFIKTVKQTERYMPYIEQELKNKAMPSDLKYIAIIESNLMPTTSPAGAKGIWQFMKGTATKYGLEVTDDVDERLNFEKSTIAALSYLHDLYNMFGDWLLTIAAYNAGENYIKNKITQQYTNNFWDLVMNAETARYISRAIATKLIYQSLKTYGFYIPVLELYPPYKYKEIAIDTSIKDLPLFAKQMNVSYYNFKKLNPWLISDKLSNAGNKKYIIRIPVDTVFKITNKLNNDTIKLIERI
ncbi:MAG: lytic transglycosylase domain-containing protein [Bacteroidales bacterium]|jgi:membrane-bound lytic murein transglycosylase D|nr:lytic transglycosylase domain-containing protein [Bacteroidales bacterium]MDI9576289.1 lytic transglycosylase domain-containing protein [Bacteroidota bacterium]MDD2593175.1 lytic transglycosylase domain-containing protein [Bacteroidales bacterium]MDD3756304.1 lytic transglycosylase domain-containing protein [Bacteroidales bacterium]MDY0401582.1 lytic transglycosylase domain-containing protein [Bacteroidales bacterium]